MIQFNIETKRLLLRNLLETDVDDMFELDSNPEVHRYLGGNIVTSRKASETIIQNVIKQYESNGIGRWAAVEKESGKFIGWSGLKYIEEEENGHVNFYDVGYRLKPAFWGKGYATESALAALEYGFKLLNLNSIIGTTHTDNKASQRALEKCGLVYASHFFWHDLPCNWYVIQKADWLEQSHSRPKPKIQVLYS